MSNTDPSGQTAYECVLADAQPACVALVPMVQSTQWSRATGPQLSTPNSIFVTHLIATAERVPQVLSLRCATVADAQSAYGTNRHQVPEPGIRTRLII